MNEWDLRKQQVSDAASWLNDLYQRNIGQPFVQSAPGQFIKKQTMNALAPAQRFASGYFGDTVESGPAYEVGRILGTPHPMNLAAAPKLASQVPGMLEGAAAIPAMVWNSRMITKSPTLKTLTEQLNKLPEGQQGAFLDHLWETQRISKNPVTGELGMVPGGIEKSEINWNAKNAKEAFNWPELWALGRSDLEDKPFSLVGKGKLPQGVQGAFNAGTGDIRVAKDALDPTKTAWHEGTHLFHTYDALGSNPGAVEAGMLAKPRKILGEAAETAYAAKAKQYLEAMDVDPKTLVDGGGIPTDDYFNLLDDFKDMMASTGESVSYTSLEKGFAKYLDLSQQGKDITPRMLKEAQDSGRRMLEGGKKFWKDIGVNPKGGGKHGQAHHLYSQTGGEALAEFTPWYRNLMMEEPTLRSENPAKLWERFKMEMDYPDNTPGWDKISKAYKDAYGIEPSGNYVKFMQPQPWGEEKPILEQFKK